MDTFGGHGGGGGGHGGGGHGGHGHSAFLGGGWGGGWGWPYYWDDGPDYAYVDPTAGYPGGAPVVVVHSHRSPWGLRG
jgi:hypothetical protein